MKCNRCKIEEADLPVNDVALCYDCALEEGDEAVAAAKFHAELYAAREENRQLRARVAVLEERERKCATVDEAEKRALIRGLQEIAGVVEAGSDPSPADVVQKVTAVVARVAELEASESLDTEDLVDEILNGLYACTRVWEAWGYGTMSESDFVQATKDGETRENVYSVLDRLRARAEKAETRVGDKDFPDGSEF